MIVVSGVPRSGTTWIGKVLSRPNSILYCHEPDNEHGNLLGYIHKQKVPRFPYLTAEDSSETGIHEVFSRVMEGDYLFGYDKSSLLIKKLLNIDEERIEKEITAKQKLLRSPGDGAFYLSLSDRARTLITQLLFKLATLLNGSKPDGHQILAKSVHSTLALPYIQHHFGSDIVLVLRHPANIVSSHMKLENPDVWRNIFVQKNLVADYLAPFKEKVSALDHPLEKAGAQVGAFYYVLSKQLSDHPEWLIAQHEQFCLNPHGEFKTLFERLGVSWSEEIAAYITDLNKEGEGYEYKRVAKKQINKWKRRLSNAQIEHVLRGYRIFPPAFYEDFQTNNSEFSKTPGRE